MLDARQIRDAEFIKNSVKRKAKVEAQQFMERTAGTIEQLQSDNTSVRAENIELTERCARLSEMNEKLTSENDELLKKLSADRGYGSETGTSEFDNAEIAGMRSEIAELSEENIRLKELNGKLAYENDRLIQERADAEPDEDEYHENHEDAMASVRAENAALSEEIARLKALCANLQDEKEQLNQKPADSESAEDHTENDQDEAIAVIRAENAELTETNARLKELVEKLADEKEELAQKLTEAKPEEESQTDENNEDAAAAVWAENAGLSEEIDRLRALCANLTDEKEQLIQKLSDAQSASFRPAAEPESERIIKAAQDKAALITEKAERDYLIKMTRANAVITQKTIAAELEFRDSLLKLKTADGELRELKTRLSKLLGEMPDGLGANASDILDRLKNQE